MQFLLLSVSCFYSVSVWFLISFPQQLSICGDAKMLKTSTELFLKKKKKSVLLARSKWYASDRKNKVATAVFYWEVNIVRAPSGCAGHSVKAAPSAKSDLTPSLPQRPVWCLLPWAVAVAVVWPPLPSALLSLLTKGKLPQGVLLVLLTGAVQRLWGGCLCGHLMYTWPALQFQPQSITSLRVRSWVRAGAEMWSTDVAL